jgi:hypothetical protein
MNDELQKKAASVMRQLFFALDFGYNYEWVTIINRTCLLDPLVIHNSPFIIHNS